MFGSDPLYGRPAAGLFQRLRVAAYAGLDANERMLVAGDTITALVDGRAPAPATPPRIAEVRPTSGRLARVSSYLLMSFAAGVGAGPPPDPARALPGIQLARGVCRNARCAAASTSAE